MLAPQSVGSLPITYFWNSAVMRSPGAQTYMPCGAFGEATLGLGAVQDGAPAAGWAEAGNAAQTAPKAKPAATSIERAFMIGPSVESNLRVLNRENIGVSR